MIEKTHVIFLVVVLSIMGILALINPVLPIGAILIVFISALGVTAISEIVKAFRK